jgi:hypothetical protein
MSMFVIRQTSPMGKSALAHTHTSIEFAAAAVRDRIAIGPYLEWSDPDGRDGLGDDRWTDDPAKAKRFVSQDEAFACWRARSKKNPTRPDGKPNRPLTAYSITIEELETQSQ